VRENKCCGIGAEKIVGCEMWSTRCKMSFPIIDVLNFPGAGEGEEAGERTGSSTGPG